MHLTPYLEKVSSTNKKEIQVYEKANMELEFYNSEDNFSFDGQDKRIRTSNNNTFSLFLLASPGA